MLTTATSPPRLLLMVNRLPLSVKRRTTDPFSKQYQLRSIFRKFFLKKYFFELVNINCQSLNDSRRFLIKVLLSTLIQMACKRNKILLYLIPVAILLHLSTLEHKFSGYACVLLIIFVLFLSNKFIVVISHLIAEFLAKSVHFFLKF